MASSASCCACKLACDDALNDDCDACVVSKQWTIKEQLFMACTSVWPIHVVALASLNSCVNDQPLLACFSKTGVSPCAIALAKHKRCNPACILCHQRVAAGCRRKGLAGSGFSAAFLRGTTYEAFGVGLCLLCVLCPASGARRDSERDSQARRKIENRGRQQKRSRAALAHSTHMVTQQNAWLLFCRQHGRS